jgi:hypothetical protein
VEVRYALTVPFGRSLAEVLAEHVMGPLLDGGSHDGRRSARGNGGRHLLWVDPAPSLALASHWTESPDHLIRDVSAAG